MSETKHTPGNWVRLSERHDEWYMSAIPIIPEGAEEWEWVALVPHHQVANADLITASPLLLAFAEHWAEAWDSTTDGAKPTFEIGLMLADLAGEARHAIAKARGATP